MEGKCVKIPTCEGICLAPSQICDKSIGKCVDKPELTLKSCSSDCAVYEYCDPSTGICEINDDVAMVGGIGLAVVLVGCIIYKKCKNSNS